MNLLFISGEHEHVITLAFNFTDPMGITFYILYILEYPKYLMGMDMEIDFKNLMGMGADIYGDDF